MADPSPVPDPVSQTSQDAIQARLKKRREPQLITCSGCGYQRPYPTSTSGPTQYADSAWKCPRCDSNMFCMFTIAPEVPSADDDLETLLAALQQAQATIRDYDAAMAALPDSLGRPLAARIELVLDNLRRESRIGVELRRELDGGIERDARAIESQWPEAAAYLRSHAHIEDGV